VVGPRTQNGCGGDRPASVDDIPITAVGLIERFQNIIDVFYRFSLFVLAIVAIISAGCIAGLPSTTCYALADAYTIALENIGGYGIFLTKLLYIFIVGLDLTNSQGKADKLVFGNWIPKLP